MKLTLPFGLTLLSLLLSACGGNVNVGGGGTGGDGGGGSGGGPICPAIEPNGQACDVIAVRCTYGESVRPECRRDWTCLNGVWTTTKGFCQDPQNCPTAAPQTGSSCSPEGDVCTYGATICECNACAGGPCMQFPAWACQDAPTTTGCPETVPNDGSSCSQTGLQCVYGNPCGFSGAIVECNGGAWTWQLDIACPA